MVIQKGLNCTPYKDSEKRHTYIKQRGQIVKSVTSGYKIVIILSLLSCFDGDKMGTMKGGQKPKGQTAGKDAGLNLEN